MIKANIEQYLDGPFLWPQRGNPAITTSVNADSNACISGFAWERLVFMTRGYKQCADLAVRYALQNPLERDDLIYPILFNYRHFLELHLKYLIWTYGKVVGIEPIWNTHELDRLWRVFTSILERYGLESTTDDQAMEERIIEFQEIDPQSFSFRFPTDKNGCVLRHNISEIDLERLNQAMGETLGYFDGCDGQLKYLKSAGL